MEHVQTSRWFLPILIGLVLAAAGASFWLAELKGQSLAYHTRDYAYFLEFAVRAFDSSYPQEVTQNPNGFNVFRFEGMEAVRSLHQSIHFEPGKYLNAMLYAIFEDPSVIYAWYAIAFFLPLIYFGSRARHHIPERYVLLICVLYVAFPSVLNAPTNDLRPFILIAPALLLAVTAFALDTSRIRRLLALGVLLLVREEGLLLALPLILIPLFEGLRDTGSMGRGIRQSLPYLIVWSCIAAIVAAYFAWAQYPNMLLRSLSNHAPVLILIGGMGLLGAVAGWHSRQKIVPLVPYALLAMPCICIGLQFLISIKNAGFLPTLFHLYFVAGIAAAFPLLIIALSHTAGRSRSIAALAIWVAIGISISVTAISDYGFVSQTHAAMRMADDAALVRTTAAQSPDARVLVDYATHQAFYRQRVVYNYERLPAKFATGSARYYPANESLVRQILPDVTLIVVSTSSMPTIRELASDATVIAENGSFLVLLPGNREE